MSQTQGPKAFIRVAERRRDGLHVLDHHGRYGLFLIAAKSFAVKRIVKCHTYRREFRRLDLCRPPQFRNAEEFCDFFHSALHIGRFKLREEVAAHIVDVGPDIQGTTQGMVLARKTHLFAGHERCHPIRRAILVYIVSHKCTSQRRVQERFCLHSCGIDHRLNLPIHVSQIMFVDFINDGMPFGSLQLGIYFFDVCLDCRADTFFFKVIFYRYFIRVGNTFDFIDKLPDQVSVGRLFR